MPICSRVPGSKKFGSKDPRLYDLHVKTRRGNVIDVQEEPSSDICVKYELMDATVSHPKHRKSDTTTQN